mmetsp:Transcript_110287/g.307303  ORF Transcript_110287/g.307303 Transcript_110287/m.307303 type:complete len:215 (-) Transcript_110287:406-1050(-)
MFGSVVGLDANGDRVQHDQSTNEVVKPRASHHVRGGHVGPGFTARSELLVKAPSPCRVHSQRKLPSRRGPAVLRGGVQPASTQLRNAGLAERVWLLFEPHRREPLCAACRCVPTVLPVAPELGPRRLGRVLLRVYHRGLGRIRHVEHCRRQLPGYAHGAPVLGHLFHVLSLEVLRVPTPDVLCLLLRPLFNGLEHGDVTVYEGIATQPKAGGGR